MSSETGKHKIVKRIARVFTLLLVLFLGVILFIRSPWGQDIIVNKLIDYVSDKTATKIEIDKLFLTFSGDIQLEGLYLEDKKGDTLLYSKLLEADIEFSPLLFDNTLELDNLEWEGVTARILRNKDAEKFNFTFFQEAFAAQDLTAEPETVEPFQLVIGSVALKDFDVVYIDAFLGIESKIICGDLLLDVDELDLMAMHFAVDNLEIQNTQVDYKQTKAISASDGETIAVLPYISIGDLSLENVQANYGSSPDDLEIQTDLFEFSINSLEADIAKARYDVEDFTLNNSNISLKIDNVKGEGQDAIVNQSSTDFQWPAFHIAASEIEMDNNTFIYGRGNTAPVKGVFNRDAISLQNFSFRSNDLAYAPKLVNLNVEALSFLEKSGFLLQQMTFKSHFQERSAKLENFTLRTNHSSITGAVALKYPSVEQLFSAPRRVSLEAAIPEIQIGMEDVFHFQPSLSSNSYLSTTKQHPLKGQIFAAGSLENIKVEDTQLRWGDRTWFSLGGTINKPPV